MRSFSFSLVVTFVAIAGMFWITALPSAAAEHKPPPIPPPRPPIEQQQDTTPQDAAPALPASPSTGEPAKAVLNTNTVQGILGKDVRSNAGEDMGRIVDVIVDQAGGSRAAIIDFGGFLGVGSRKIAVDWSALHFTLSDGTSQITLDLSRDQVKAAPEYSEGKPVVVLGTSGSAQSTPADQP
jgi:hypothetical protein